MIVILIFAHIVFFFLGLILFLSLANSKCDTCDNTGYVIGFPKDQPCPNCDKNEI